MAQLGNNINLGAMIRALEEHIATSRTVLNQFQSAQQEQHKLTVAKGDGSGHTDDEITISVVKLISLADVASAQTSFTAAKDIFISPDPV